MANRIYLAPPHMSGLEIDFVKAAFEENWIAPVGPDLNAFEAEFSAYTGIRYSVALSSGTAGIHLGLQILGVQAGDEVLVSDLTFIGSVNPVMYLGARPIFVDSERESWNLDPELLAEFLEKRAKAGRIPKALILVHLYGQSANLERIAALCEHYGVALLEDAAEALGSQYKNRQVGSFGKLAVFSFNGNKIITTSGGGMLVSNDEEIARRARHLASQAREAAAHYEHHEIGYNYRLSNILAAIGRGQLRVLDERVQVKREIFRFYQENLGSLGGIDFMPEAAWGKHSRWLTTILIEAQQFGASREDVRLALEAENIESRPVWKPMHLQAVFHGMEFLASGVSEDLFAKGLCLPSGTALSQADLQRIVSIIRALKR